MADRTNAEIHIEATPARIMQVIADVAAYPEWSEGMQSVEVLTASADGRPLTARFDFSSGPVKDTFVLEYDWNGADTVSWHLTEGGVIKRQDGTYTLTAAGSGTAEASGGKGTDGSSGSTLVRYDLAVELTIPMIGLIKKRAEKRIIRSALAGLKERVESL